MVIGTESRTSVYFCIIALGKDMNLFLVPHLWVNYQTRESKRSKTEFQTVEKKATRNYSNIFLKNAWQFTNNNNKKKKNLKRNDRTRPQETRH